MSGLRVEDVARVRLITLDRPDARNAFDTDLYDGVAAALEEAAAAPDLSVCVITGAGPVFSAGQDLKALRSPDHDGKAAAAGFERFCRALYGFDKPLVAAVNGPAVGVGLTMLVHCDLVYVSETARFRAPFVSLGLVPEAASSVLLPARIGPQAAARLLLGGAWMEATEAVAAGLALRCCSPEKLLAEAMAGAAEMAALPLAALVRAKRLLLAGRAEAVLAAHERETAELGRIMREFLG